MQRALARLACSDATLSELSLAYADIGDDGACALAAALRHTAAPLTSLSLFHNAIGDKGACALAAALCATAAPLDTLNLGDNLVGNDGVRALAAALRCTEAPLTRLYVHNNARVGDDGARALADALDDGNAWPLDRADSQQLFARIGAHASSVLRRFAQPGNTSLLELSVNNPRYRVRIQQLLAARQSR
jgi:hypothetical protein